MLLGRKEEMSSKPCPLSKLAVKQSQIITLGAFDNASILPTRRNLHAGTGRALYGARGMEPRASNVQERISA